MNHHNVTKNQDEVLLNIVSRIEKFTDKLAKQSGKGYRLRCPAHNGTDSNLYIANGSNRLILKCHSNHCDGLDIVQAIGLNLSDLYYESKTGLDLQNHKAKVSDKQFRKELCSNLMIVLCGLNEDYSLLFKDKGDAGFERYLLSVDSAIKGLAEIRRRHG